MNLQILKQKLSEFGLNPKDWKVRLQPESGPEPRLEIRGRRGQTYRFVGRAEQNRWLELKLVV